MLLAFVVVLFGGLAFMFLTILRGQEQLIRAMREERAVLFARLDALERAGWSPSAVADAASSQPQPQARIPEAPEASNFIPPSGPTSPGRESRRDADPESAPGRLDLAVGDRKDRPRNNGLPDLKI